MEKVVENGLNIDVNIACDKTQDTTINEIESLQKIVFEQSKTISYLQEKIDYLIRQKFGAKSEKLNVNQPTLFDEIDDTADYIKEEDQDDIVVSSHKRKSKARPLADLPHVQIEHDLDEKEKICTCGCELRRFKEIISYQYDVIPATFQILDHIRFAYSCPNKCGAGIKTADRFDAPLPKHQVSASLLATIGVQKFEDGLPLTRQAKIYKQRFGVNFNDTTLSNWMIKASEIRLSKMIELMNEEINNSSYIQADETTLQVLNEKGKKATAKSYLWVRVNKDEDKKMVLLHYSNNRASVTAEHLFSDFKGYLQTDGYPGYNQSAQKDGVVQLACFAHARRRFADILKSNVSNHTSNQLSQRVIDLIAKLYKVEKEIKTEPPNIKQQIRAEKAKPIINELETYLNENLMLANKTGGAIKTAFNYITRQFPKLIIYLEDGRLEIDNNSVENHIRPIAMGRKNWLFATSTKGATALANWYSIIESAKINHLDPYKYLKHLFYELPRYDRQKRNIQELLPWNVVIQQ